jgi:hypothetical protein
MHCKFRHMAKKLSACPSWLSLSEDRTSFVFLPDRAETVRRIFELSLSGLGCYTIAKQLNHKKVPAFGPSGRWDQSTVHNMLASRATIGEHQPKQYRNEREYPVGAPISNYYPAVIEEDLFLAVQRGRQRNLRTGRGRKGRFVTNLFPKLLTCAYCGAAVKFHSNNSYKSLVCMTVLERRGCFRKAWSCKDFEKSLFRFFSNLETDQTVTDNERRALLEIIPHIRALQGPNVYEARMRIAIALRKVVSELKVASAGPCPVPGEPVARILRDQPGRYFEVRLSGSEALRVGFA